MILITILITVAYVLLIGAFIYGFYKVKVFTLTSEKAVNSFSIIIPFRNETHNLPTLLGSISKLQFPKEKFEIILINDDSEDSFESIIKEFIQQHSHLDVKIINNIRKSNSPKKDAIETGIAQSKFDWILTTDADCVLPELWIRTYDAFIQKNNPYLVAGPVSFKSPSSFLDHFQLLDFSAMIGCTIGAFGIKKPFMCNGANLCYRKEIFHELNGFKGNNHLASGDDIFLLEKMNSRFPTKTKYLKSDKALVHTSTEPTLPKLIQQRIRWASKSTSYTNLFPKLVGLIVLLANSFFVLILIHSIILNGPSFLSTTLLILKIAVDYILIWITLSFLQNRKSIIWFPIISIIYPLFIVFTSLFTLFSSRYKWKNRSFQHK